MRSLLNPALISCFLFLLPAALHARNLLFVFHGGSPTAGVYDAESFEKVATVNAGFGASYAFGIADTVDARQFQRFYVVSGSAITILNADFSVRGSVFLDGSGPRRATAAALSAKENRLLVAAGEKIYVVDTSEDRIVARLSPGFVTTGIAIEEDESSAYLMSATSPFIRSIDLSTDRLTDSLIELPTAPTSFGFRPNQAAVYVATPGAIYDLANLKLASVTAKRLGTNDRLRVAGSQESLFPPAQSDPNYSSRLNGNKLQIQELVVAGNDQVFLRTGGRLLHGAFSAPGKMEELLHPQSGESLANRVVDIDMSARGGRVFIALGGEPAVLKLDDADPGQSEELLLSSTPEAIAVVSPRVPQSTGMLEQVSGNNSVVAGGKEFTLVVRARDEDGDPQSGVAVFVSDVTLGLADCFPGVTDADGLASLYCIAAETNATRTIQVTVSDAMGRSAPRFSIQLRRPTDFEGITKVEGDFQTVAVNSSFQLIVAAAENRVLKAGVEMEIDVDSDVVDVDCPARRTTGANGQASIVCTTREFPSELGDEPDPVEATITVTDPQDRSVVFTIIIALEAFSTETGLFIISGDDQVVRQGFQFPLPLVVRSLIDGVPQADELLRITVDDPTRVFCPGGVVTDENGFAEIQCRAGVSFGEEIRRIVVAAPGLRVAEFLVVITQQGGGVATDITILNDSPFRGPVAERLEDALEIRVIDNAGRGVSGREVFFFSDDDVTFDPPNAVTDPRGEATTTVILGCNARDRGSLEVGFAEGETEDSIEFRSEPGKLSQILKLRGDNQVGAPGEALTSAALVVRVSDACGNGIRGEALTWHVTPRERATLSNVFTRTNRSGEGSAIVRLGSYGGPFGVTVAAGEERTTFNVTVDLEPTQLAMLSGDQQTITSGQFAAQPLVVEVLGDNAFGVSDVDVQFVVTQGPATLTSPTAETDEAALKQAVNAAGTENGGVAQTTGPAIDLKTDGLGLAFARVRATGQGPITVEARAIGQAVTFQLGTGVVGPSAPVEAFVNGASFRPGWVPGSLGSVFIVGLLGDIDGVVPAAEAPFPTTLEDVSVTVNGIPAPIISLINVNGQEQINVQVPFGVSEGEATVLIERNELNVTVEGVPILDVQPGIFEFASNGNLFAAALDVDFNVITPSNPASPGDIVQLFLTGLGSTIPQVGTNVAGPVPAAETEVTPIVGLDDKGAPVLGSFYAPGLFTVYQINFRVPDDAQPGNRKLNVFAEGVGSQNSLLPVGP